MKYYPHHIGDFDRATRHLSRIERSVYRDLVELYYDTERPLTADRAALCRKIIAKSDEETTAVEQALNEFFIETPAGWYHDRCEMEIAAYRANSSQKAIAGRASAAARRAKAEHALNGCSTAVEQAMDFRSTNQEPVTNNHKPITIQKIKQATSPPASPTAPPAPSVDNLVQPIQKQRDASTGTRLPTDWALSQELGDWALAEGLPRERIRQEADRFRDYWVAKPGAAGRKTDWSATWRNWVRKATENQTGAHINGTHRQNSGPLSAVDRANAAISARARERDQREALQRGGRTFNADGAVMETDDRNVRSPLD